MGGRNLGGISSAARTVGDQSRGCQFQQGCAAGAGLVGGEVAGQLVAHVVFGQEDLTDAAVDVRLVLFHPKNFGRGEAGKRVVAGDAHEIFLAKPQAHIIALFAGALVVPEDGRPQGFAVFVQQYQPVHLAAHADRGDLRRIDTGLIQRRAHALHGAVPPQVGVLFAPQGWGVSKGYSAAATATILPSASMIRDLVAVVEESMPIRYIFPAPLSDSFQ